MTISREAVSQCSETSRCCWGDEKPGAQRVARLLRDKLSGIMRGRPRGCRSASDVQMVRAPQIWVVGKCVPRLG